MGSGGFSSISSQPVLSFRAARGASRNDVSASAKSRPALGGVLGSPGCPPRVRAVPVIPCLRPLCPCAAGRPACPRGPAHRPFQHDGSRTLVRESPALVARHPFDGSRARQRRHERRGLFSRQFARAIFLRLVYRAQRLAVNAHWQPPPGGGRLASGSLPIRSCPVTAAPVPPSRVSSTDTSGPS